MKGIVFMVVVAAGLLWSRAWCVADSAPVDAKQQVAAEYFEALVAAEVEKANALIDVPFSLDRTNVLNTREEVEAAHQQIAESKGKRAVPQYTIELTDKALILDEAVFGKHVAYRIAITLPGRQKPEILDIYVADTDTAKVIGFSD